MKLLVYSIVVMAAASLTPFALGAPSQSELEELKSELRELRQRTEDLERKILQLETNAPPTAAVPSAVPVTPIEGTDSNVAPPTPAAEMQVGVPSGALLRAGPAYLNLGLSSLLDVGWSSTADVEKLEGGGHDPVQRGFSLPNTELTLDGAVDPYFKGFANIVFLLDEDNETQVELEEAYLLSSSLPANLQLKAGQFQAEFGRQNPQHAHAWSFVDQPLVLNRLLGPDGLRNPGARLSWLMPTPFYSEIMLTVMNGAGETASSFRNRGDADAFGVDRVHGRATLGRDLSDPGDLLFVPRWASSLDVTDNQTVAFGTSAAFGPNDTGSHRRTEIYGIDGYWKWKSPNAVKGFPFVSVQSEALFRRFEAGADPEAIPPLPSETLKDWGFYTQALWGFKPLWIVGLRGEFVSGNAGVFDAHDPIRADRTRFSPDLTWHPTEFSKIRLQYNYDLGQDFGDEHSVWLQLEFLLGAHAAHKF